MDVKVKSTHEGTKRSPARIAVTLVSVLLASLSVKAWAATGGNSDGLSVSERVAALRAKAAEVAQSGRTQLPEAAAMRLAQDDRKKWKNE
jgi:hypothetical protein